MWLPKVQGTRGPRNQHVWRGQPQISQVWDRSGGGFILMYMVKSWISPKDLLTAGSFLSNCRAGYLGSAPTQLLVLTPQCCSWPSLLVSTEGRREVHRIAFSTRIFSIFLWRQYPNIFTKDSLTWGKSGLIVIANHLTFLEKNVFFHEKQGCNLTSFKNLFPITLQIFICVSVQYVSLEGSD